LEQEKQKDYQNSKYTSNDFIKVRAEDFYIFPEKNEYEIQLKLRKPELKSNILAIITQEFSGTMGLKWFDFDFSNKNQNERILLSITEDGFISFFKFKRKNLDFNPQVDLSKLSTNPFFNLEEEWIRIAKFSNEKPIKDFHFNEKTFNLYILNIDNYINFFQLEENKKPVLIYKKSYTFNLNSGQNLNKFILTTDESCIFGFFDEYLIIFKNSKPFYRLYSFNFYDIQYFNKFQNYLKKEERIKSDKNINGNPKNIKNENQELKKIEKLKANKKNAVKNKKFENIEINKNKLNKNKSKKNLGKKDKPEKFEKNLNQNGNIIQKDDEIENEEEEFDLENSDLFEDEEEDFDLDSEGLNDFIEKNENLIFQDENYISNNFQKALITLDNKFVVFNFFNNKSKIYYLIKFHLDYFSKNIVNYEFFHRCYKGQMPELCQIIMSSFDKIFFTFPPSMYLKNIFYKENEFFDIQKLLNTKIKFHEIQNNIYFPIAIMNKETLFFIELNKSFQTLENNDIKINYDKIIDKYIFCNYTRYCYDGLDFKWIYNNTLLFTAENKLMRLVKFTYDQFRLGLLLKRELQIN